MKSLLEEIDEAILQEYGFGDFLRDTITHNVEKAAAGEMSDDDIDDVIDIVDGDFKQLVGRALSDYPETFEVEIDDEEARLEMKWEIKSQKFERAIESAVTEVQGKAPYRKQLKALVKKIVSEVVMENQRRLRRLIKKNHKKYISSGVFENVAKQTYNENPQRTPAGPKGLAMIMPEVKNGKIVLEYVRKYKLKYRRKPA